MNELKQELAVLKGDRADPRARGTQFDSHLIEKIGNLFWGRPKAVFHLFNDIRLAPRESVDLRGGDTASGGALDRRYMTRGLRLEAAGPD